MTPPDEDWERDVLASCLRSSPYLRQAVPVLTPGYEHWSTPEHEWIWRVLADCWIAAGELASARIFRARLDKVEDEARREVYGETLLALVRREVETPRLALDELRAFARMTAIRGGLWGGVELLERGDWDAAAEAIGAGLDRAKRTGAKGSPTSWGKDAEARIARYRSPKSRFAVRTPLRRITQAMSGGPGHGHFCLAISVTNVGKSAWGTALGYQAAIRGGCVVLHLVTEETEEMTMARYDARVSGVERKRLLGRLEASELDAIETTLRRRGEVLADRLYVQELGDGASVDEIRGAAEYVRGISDSERPLFIVVDLIDDLRAGKDNHVRDAAEVAVGLKNLSKDRTLGRPIVWGLAQARRLSPRKRIWAEDVSESYDRSRKCDFMMGLNEGDEDAGTSIAGRAHLEATIAKNRLGGDKRVVIHLSADMGTCLFDEIVSYEVDDTEGSS